MTSRRGDSADLERLGDEIAELAAHLYAATYRLLVRLHEFDRREGWAGRFRSCAHWLSWRTGIDLGAAREKVRVARALAELPRVGDALRRGELSYAKARAITRVGTPANEEALLEVARHGTAAHVEKVVRAWRRADRLEQAREDDDRHARRDLTLVIDDDGTYVLRGRLEPEVGALLERALDAAVAAGAIGAPAVAGPVGAALRPAPTADVVEDAPTHAQRRADAIGLIAERALASLAEPVASHVRAGPRPTGAVEAPALLKGGACRDDRGAVDVPALPKGGARRGDRGAVEVPTLPEGGARRDDRGAVGVPALPKGGARRDDRGAVDVPALAKGGARRGDRGAVEVPTLPKGGACRDDRFLVVVHVDDHALRVGSENGHAVLADGIRVSAETSRRIACDAARVHMRHDANGSVLDVGRRTRAVPTPIRRALEHRDRGCRFPGCTNKFCDAHHIVHWADGGPTRLDNLVLLCRAHHRAVHEGGYRVEMSAEGDVRFRKPDGRPLPAAPMSPVLPENPCEQLNAQHRALGLDIDAWTATSAWDGSPLDVDWAVLTLRPRPVDGTASDARRGSTVV